MQIPSHTGNGFAGLFRLKFNSEINSNFICLFGGIVALQLTNLLKALSPAFLEDLKIGSSSAVDVALSGGQLIVKPITKPIYKLSDLLAKCDTSAKKAEEDKRWIGAPRMGNEIL